MNLSEVEAPADPQLLKLATQMGMETSLARASRTSSSRSSGARAQRRVDLRRWRARDPADGFGFLRSPEQSYLAGPDDIYISPSQIRRFNLRTGDTISGLIRPPKDGERYFRVAQGRADQLRLAENARSKGAVREPDAAAPDAPVQARARHGSTEDLTAAHDRPDAPLGKGQRGLIVSPPKAGKTMLLQNIANSITGKPPRGVPDRCC